MSKHHFVPKLLLKRFKSEDGELFYFNLYKPNQPIVHRNPDTIFYERRLNTLSDNSQSREAQFAERIDTPFDALLTNIEASFGNGNRVDLTEEARTIVACFVVYQWKRRPSALTDILASNTQTKLSPSEEDALEIVRRAVVSSEPEMQNFAHDLRAQVLVHLNPDVVESVLSRGFCFARNRTNNKFIVGSNPICRHVFLLNSDQAEKFEVDQNVMPISNDKLLLIGPSELDGRILDICSSSDVRSMNSKIALQSNMIAGPNIQDIRALATRMARAKKSG